MSPSFQTTNMKTLSVLMPVYNEERTLRSVVRRVLDAPVDTGIELVCVDDGSQDDSLSILQELAADDQRIKVVAHVKNMGKGRALRTAIEAMTGDIGIVQDADLEYDPADYPRVIAPILEGRADAVYGSRFASSPVRRVLFFWHSLGNRLLTLLSNMANDLNLTDMETGYKAIRADFLKDMRLTSDRFGFEPEVTARLRALGARIYEVPISYYGRTYAEGKHIGWRDGLEALWLIFKFRFIDRRASVDPAHSTLESLGSVPQVARWTLAQFSDVLGDSILEAGCGSGNLTRFLINKRRLVCVDIDQRHVVTVDRQFGHLENVSVLHGDLEDEGLYSELSAAFDSIVSVNVVEHLEHPEVALRGFYKALASGGRAVILVPAHQWLFSEADRALGHWRRYTEGTLADLVESAGFSVESMRQFNRLGVLGWATNRALRRTDIARWQARLFGLMLPVARLVEQVRVLPGLSLIVVARKL